MVLPLLVLIAMIIMEGGSFIRAHQVINNAAREAAHIASLYKGRDYIDPATKANGLGIAAACKYLNNYQKAFPGWPGDPNCGAPFTISVQDITDPTDPAAVTVDGVNMPSTLAVVTYQYQIKYLPLSFFGWNGATLSLKGRAQFRNFHN